MNKNENTINWLENKVFNPNAPQKPNRATEPYYMPETQAKPMQNVASAEKKPENVQKSMFRDNMQKSTYPEMMQTTRQSGPMPSTQYPEFMQPTQTGQQVPVAPPAIPLGFVQGPPPVMDRNYIAGYLKSNIGKSVRAEFALSTGLYLDKTGVLREVGVNYFVLEDFISHAMIMCDLYSVKFVTIL